MSIGELSNTTRMIQSELHAEVHTGPLARDWRKVARILGAVTGGASEQRSALLNRVRVPIGQLLIYTGANVEATQKAAQRMHTLAGGSRSEPATELVGHLGLLAQKAVDLHEQPDAYRTLITVHWHDDDLSTRLLPGLVDSTAACIEDVEAFTTLYKVSDDYFSRYLGSL